MIYFLIGKQIFHDRLGWGRVTLIGTETTLPRALDNCERRSMVREGKVLRPDERGRSVGANWIKKRLAQHRKKGTFEGGGYWVRQMEGGGDEARRLYEQFKHLQCDPDDIHVYAFNSEFRAFVEEHTEAWTGENAVALGMPKPKRSHEDREAPIRNGLAGRLKRRPG